MPQERFWQRYSSRHEFPFSLSSSAFLHLAGLLALIVLGLVISAGSSSNTPLTVGAVVLQGDGNPEGPGGVPEAGGPSQGKEAVEQPGTTQPNKSVDSPSLNQPVEPAVSLPTTGPNRPLEAEVPELGPKLDGIGQKARGLLEPRLTGPKGPGGPRGNISAIDKRRARWTMIFNTRDGYDYLRQLHDLNAFLAVPQADGRHMVYRELGRPPLAGRIEDISHLPQLSWHDTKPESVRSLATAMGLQEVPLEIIAFFPTELENELLNKEMNYSGGKSEDDIEKTIFAVKRLRDRAGYQATVTGQRIKQKR